MDHRRIRPLAAMLSAGALALAGCGQASDASGLEPVTALSVVGTDAMAFSPAAYAVPAGEAIELVLAAESAVEHDFVIEGAGRLGSAHPQDGGHGHDEDDDHDGDDSHDGDDGGGHSHDEEVVTDDLHVAHAQAGEQVRSLFLVSEPGTYEVYCSIPGHRAAGMTATLAVVGTDG